VLRLTKHVEYFLLLYKREYTYAAYNEDEYVIMCSQKIRTLIQARKV